jgi:cell division septum initiation protein DivIVA
VSSSDNTGLGLFDDAASAVGNFPTALRGYDRTAVDDYVRTLEASVVQSRRRASQLEQQISGLQDQLAGHAEKGHGGHDLDYSNLGGRANDILRLAQEQARELVENATIEAEKVKEAARREADSLRNSAAREGNAIKSGGVAEIDQLRSKLHAEVQAQVDKSKAEAESLVAAARRQAESVRREADHEAQTTRQNAYLDTENLRRTVEREAAEIRQQVAAEREQAMGQLKQIHDDANAKTAAMLAEATKHHDQSAERLEADITEAARVRAEAVAEAEQTKVQAIEEAEAKLSTAKQQASAISERTQQEFTWRKQQLRRETELLHQRKQAVLSQLASLSALAEQTANAFPDLDEPSEIESEELPGDQTVIRPAGQAQGVRDRTDKDVPADDGPTQTTAPESSAAAPGRPNTQPKPGPTRPGGKGESSKAGSAGSDPEVDGDATVLVPPSQRPAGTDHISGQRRPPGSN